MKPSDYSHAARIYDYDPDQVYEVYCQVLRTTDLYLEPGEVVIDSPFVSDSERWIIGAGVNQQMEQSCSISMLNQSRLVSMQRSL